MDDHGQDAFYTVTVGTDGLVLARQVSPDADIHHSLISYLGDDAPAKAKAASWALSVLLARETD